MILLLSLTVITVLIVVQNTMELLIGIKALPLSSRVSLKLFNKCHPINIVVFCLISFLAIYVRYNVVIDAGTMRCCIRNSANIIFNRNVVDWFIYVASDESN